MRGLTAHVSGYEELAVQAARLGGRDRVVEAMLAHPLIGQYDQAEALTDLLLAENAALPALGERPVSRLAPAALAIDGGNSKTDVALVAPTGPCSRWSAVPACRSGSATRPSGSSTT